MSAERRYNQRRFQLEHSTTTTAGEKTVFIEHMGPGTAVPPHYHTRFSETFDLISGTMQVFASEQDHSAIDLDLLARSPQDLQIGVPVTIKPGVIHRYVCGAEDTMLRCTLTPGNADFERLLMIMNGTAEDGSLAEQDDSVLLLALSADLADAAMLGEVGDVLAGLKAGKGPEIAAFKEKMLKKYDNQENLRRLLEK